MVLQDTHLFTGTVRENIRYGRLDATDDEVMEKLFTLKEEECKKESQMNKLIRWIPNRMQRKVDDEVNTYIKEVHFNLYENDDKQ